ncbi:substrate-binding periplasmic protein [Chitinimonas koreensis]|uniref:substrate-binding periplasmic protein n=1 Tax=Chitinimonas koreensis TaxID=356302 RepID=UPI00146F9ECA|nr:transporter substrate-binding domain-containing protein [Chitinimonas koreensis]QNM95918.1 transporter substrate-binding domain-containing protein [Chitinimonas koreensis]
MPLARLPGFRVHCALLHGLLAVAAALPAVAVPGLPPGCKQMIASGNPEYPPFLWRDANDQDRLVGANAELMQRLSKELGVPITVKYAGPWGRVQEEVKQGRVDLIAGAFFTLQRQEYMDYFWPAIRNTRTVIWTRDDHALRYGKWADLVGFNGITVINNSFGEDFDRYARDNLEIQKVPSLESALKMLALSRADYLIYEEAPGLAYAAKLGIKGLRAASASISNEDLLLTLSHKSACNSGEMRGRIARAMQKLARDKVMDDLIERSIQLWRVQAK